MRRLLVSAGLTALVGLAALWGEPAEATHYSQSRAHVWLARRLRRSLPRLIQQRARLGMAKQCVSYIVRLRLFIVSSQSTQSQVGIVRTRNASNGCYRILADIFRTDERHVGTVTNQDALVSSNKSYKIYGRSQGIYSDTSIGSMVWPDNCTSTARHVMSWFTPGSYTTSYSKNTGIPTEAERVLCGRQYAPWESREYVFSYWGP